MPPGKGNLRIKVAFSFFAAAGAAAAPVHFRIMSAYKTARVTTLLVISACSICHNIVGESSLTEDLRQPGMMECEVLREVSLATIQVHDATIAPWISK
jgi:hypothetical protein